MITEHLEAKIYYYYEKYIKKDGSSQQEKESNLLQLSKITLLPEKPTAWAVQKKANYFKLNRKFVELPSFIYGNLVLRAVILKAIYLVFIR